MMDGQIFLIYVGDGSGFVGVPARDMTLEEAQQFDVTALVASGLYKIIEQISEPAAPEGKPKRKTKGD